MANTDTQSLLAIENEAAEPPPCECWCQGFDGSQCEWTAEGRYLVPDGSHRDLCGPCARHNQAEGTS